MNKEALLDSVNSYLAIKEVLGFKVYSTKILLMDFVDYVSKLNFSGFISAQIAIDWACVSSKKRGIAGQTARLSQVRGFLFFLKASFPETEIPSHNLLATVRRQSPYLFTQEQINQLLNATLRMKPQDSLRPILWYTLIGLLASTGLRIGEALRLKISDVNLDNDPAYLRIVETKFRKSRLVPLHPTTTQKLKQYVKQRQKLGYNALSDFFFVSEKGTCLDKSCVWLSFRRLTKRLGMLPNQGGRYPSLHSLRHSFAIERLRQWYILGMDVQKMIANLSVYLGHVKPQDSYWYLTATPELLLAASERFLTYQEGSKN